MYQFQKHETSIQLVCYVQTRNKKRLNLFKIVAILALLFFNSRINAQCNFQIKNNTSCVITVNYSIIDFVPGQGCSPANICNSGYNISIPAGQSHVIVCSGCSNPCNVQVQLLDVGGTLSNTISVDAINTTSASWSGGTGCSSGNIQVSPGSTFDFEVN